MSRYSGYILFLTLYFVFFTNCESHTFHKITFLEHKYDFCVNLIAIRYVKNGGFYTLSTMQAKKLKKFIFSVLRLIRIYYILLSTKQKITTYSFKG